MIRYILLILFISIGFLQAQQHRPVIALNELELQPPSVNERLSIQFNSSFLLVGETLYLTIHCFNADTNSFSNLSSVAYVELINEDARPVLQTKIALEKGRGSGDLFLPSTLRTGNYTLIAYTNWMRNFPIESFFRTHITIINPFKKPISELSNGKEEFQVTFFPEGGGLLAEHSNTIAFIIKQKESNRGNYTISIVDNQGNKVTDVTVSNEGTGTFTLTPQIDREYKAIVSNSYSSQIIKLPIPKKEGFGIHVANAIDFYNVKLMHRGPSESKGYTLIVQHHTGDTLYKSPILFESDTAVISIPKKILRSGISQIFVLNSEIKIESVRKVFVRAYPQNALVISLEKKNFNPREKVSLKVRLNERIDQAYLTARARIIDKQISKDIDPNPIDLTKSDEFIDFQMMTNQHPVLSPETDRMNPDTNLKYLPDMRGMLISGTVTNLSGIPLSHESVYISLPSSNYLFLVSKTDSLGNFYFTTNKLKYDSDIIFQVPQQQQNNYKLMINDVFLNDYEKFVPPSISLDSSWGELIKKRSIMTQIENTYYIEKQDSIVSGQKSTKFYGTPDKTYLLDNYVRFPSLDDVLIEYIPEISLRKKGDQFTIRVVNFKNGVPFEEDPLILLDGVPLFDHNQVIGLNPLLIKKIEIIKRRYFYGPLEISGIISLETYAGDAMKITSAKYTLESMIGLQPPKIYYSPDHSEKALKRIPDFRVQLYWNPSLITTDKSTSLEFYTSDVEGDFEIIIEGTDSKGNRLMVSDIISVAKP